MLCSTFYIFIFAFAQNFFLTWQFDKLSPFQSNTYPNIMQICITSVSCVEILFLDRQKSFFAFVTCPTFLWPFWRRLQDYVYKLFCKPFHYDGNCLHKLDIPEISLDFSRHFTFLYDCIDTLNPNYLIPDLISVPWKFYCPVINQERTFKKMQSCEFQTWN